jgi:hypothetical protein
MGAVCLNLHPGGRATHAGVWRQATDIGKLETLLILPMLLAHCRIAFAKSLRQLWHWR